MSCQTGDHSNTVYYEYESTNDSGSRSYKDGDLLLEMVLINVCSVR